MNHLFELLSNADIADCVFPMGNLEMHFDSRGNLIIGEQCYTAQEILHQEEFMLSEIFKAVHL